MSSAPRNRVSPLAPININPLQQYQVHLQANQADLGQQLPLPQRASQTTQASSIYIATQQQQQLINKSMEKQNEAQLDKSRVTLLLEINAELLKEVLNVQPKFKSPDEAKNDPIFRECMRRLQQNLAYLAAIADRSHKPASHIPPCPGVLIPPPDMPILDVLYKKLLELYPGVNPTNPTASRTPQNVSPGARIQQDLTEGPPGAQPNAHPHPNMASSPPPQTATYHSSSPGMQQHQLMTQQQPHTPRHQHAYQSHQSHIPTITQHNTQLQNQQQIQQIPQQYTVQLQHRQAMMQARVQQQQPHSHVAGQMAVPVTIGMTMGPSNMNGMTTITPQQGISVGMMSGVNLVPVNATGSSSSVGSMGGIGYGAIGGMTAPGTINAMNSIGPMNGMTQLGQINNPAMNITVGMNGIPANLAQGGFGEINSQQIWTAPGSSWQGA